MIVALRARLETGKLPQPREIGQWIYDLAAGHPALLTGRARPSLPFPAVIDVRCQADMASYHLPRWMTSPIGRRFGLAMGRRGRSAG